MKPFLISLTIALVFSLGATTSLAEGAASSFQQQSSALDGRLEETLRSLATTRDRIAREKLPLSKAVSSLEAEVAVLRKERARFQKIQDANTIDLGSLRKQVASLGEQDDFTKSRLNEFVRDFEGRLNIAELPRFEALTEKAKFADKNASLDADGKQEAQVRVVQAALERLRSQLGGYRFEGEALYDGEIREGRFISMGPTMFFANKDGSVSGLVEAQLNAPAPVVVRLPSSVGTGLATIASTGQGSLPLDPSLGKALKIEKARKTVGEYVADGGVVGYVILALGLAALLLTAFKAFEILGFEVTPHESVDEILNDLEVGSQAAAAKRAQQIEGVGGEMLQIGVQHAGESRSMLEELLFERVLRVRPRLERFLPFLSITAAAAPLLGLLGTVIGMINTFQLITIFGTGDAKSLSSGISEALMTTALGLVVAIPTLILHGALSRMAKRKLSLLEEISVAFVNGIDLIRGTGPRVSDDRP